MKIEQQVCDWSWRRTPTSEIFLAFFDYILHIWAVSSWVNQDASKRPGSYADCNSLFLMDHIPSGPSVSEIDNCLLVITDSVCDSYLWFIFNRKNGVTGRRWNILGTRFCSTVSKWLGYSDRQVDQVCQRRGKHSSSDTRLGNLSFSFYWCSGWLIACLGDRDFGAENYVGSFWSSGVERSFGISGNKRRLRTDLSTCMKYTTFLQRFFLLTFVLFRTAWWQ